MSTRLPLPKGSLRVGVLVVLTALGLFAPGCRTTTAVQCGDGFCPPDSVCSPSQDPPVCVPSRGCGNGTLDEADGEACDDGNILNDDGCNSTCKSDETCGNRFVDDHLEEEPEECDDGQETRNCNADCTFSVCGDGKVNKVAGEVCDDGGTEAGDGCDAECQSEECGNGELEEAFNEECDDGNKKNDDGCSVDCKLETCGNGKRDPGEQCDDGNKENHDSCVIVNKKECFTAFCGDGYVWNEDGGHEECDDAGESDTCNANCTLAACGDGIRNAQAGEACDDGHETTACNKDCTIALCGDGTRNPTRSEECDDGGESLACNTNCTLSSCGDGYLNRTAGELCDEDGETATCDADCTPALCGDGRKNTKRGEYCDEAGETGTCDADCTQVKCGDGTRNQTVGEQCDTGGESISCNVDCTFATCGDHKVNKARNEKCDDGGESATCNADCTTAACGDGKLNATFVVDLRATDETLTGEPCDPNTGTTTNAKRAQADGATCDSDCSPVRCGDGYPNTVAGEECDLEYHSSGPPPNRADCDKDCTLPACGDGLVNEKVFIRLLGNNQTVEREQCDPATGVTGDGQRALADTDGCDHDCSTARCGDAYVNSAAGEECEHDFRGSGTPPSTGNCYSDCTLARCGDGVESNHVINEACDPGTGITPGTTNAARSLAAADAGDCDRDCTSVACGDGHVNGAVGENCDDGNKAKGDGCDENCHKE